jgi:hypothetical protein
MNDGRTFFYHAQASAIGGVFRRPFVDVLESQAATALPITGGIGNKSQTNFNFRDTVKFDSASTQVTGNQNPVDGSYNTLATTTIVGLNIANMVMADRIVARISTIHSADDTETRVVPTGSEFVGLRIGGEPINAELDLSLFTDLNTSAKFKKRYQEDKAFKEDMRSRFLWGKLEDSAPQHLKARYKWQSDPAALPESQGIMPCSLVKSVGRTNLKVYGNVIIVPDFGTIYLAEYQVKESSRRLNMMRLMLGSPMEGDITVCGIEGNGTVFP